MSLVKCGPIAVGHMYTLKVVVVDSAKKKAATWKLYQTYSYFQKKMIFWPNFVWILREFMTQRASITENLHK